MEAVSVVRTRFAGWRRWPADRWGRKLKEAHGTSLLQKERSPAEWRTAPPEQMWLHETEINYPIDLWLTHRPTVLLQGDSSLFLSHVQDSNFTTSRDLLHARPAARHPLNTLVRQADDDAAFLPGENFMHINSRLDLSPRI
jgi:hypothetical protein